MPYANIRSSAQSCPASSNQIKWGKLQHVTLISTRAATMLLWTHYSSLPSSSPFLIPFSRRCAEPAGAPFYSSAASWRTLQHAATKKTKYLLDGHLDGLLHCDHYLHRAVHYVVKLMTSQVHAQLGGGKERPGSRPCLTSTGTSLIRSTIFSTGTSTCLITSTSLIFSTGTCVFDHTTRTLAHI